MHALQPVALAGQLGQADLVGKILYRFRFGKQLALDVSGQTWFAPLQMDLAEHTLRSTRGIAITCCPIRQAGLSCMAELACARATNRRAAAPGRGEPDERALRSRLPASRPRSVRQLLPRPGRPVLLLPDTLRDLQRPLNQCQGGVSYWKRPGSARFSVRSARPLRSLPVASHAPGTSNWPCPALPRERPRPGGGEPRAAWPRQRAWDSSTTGLYHEARRGRGSPERGGPGPAHYPRHPVNASRCEALRRRSRLACNRNCCNGCGCAASTSTTRYARTSW